MLEFHDDAIVLSGETGTKLKSEIIGRYYPLWWNIASGGSSGGFRNRTAIIEMNAGSGEDYIKDIDKTILGSSGHALSLKANNPNASKLKVILVEEDNDCSSHLKNVIKKRWSDLSYSSTFDESEQESVYLLDNASDALNIVEQIKLGNSLFFFDPLLYTGWAEIELIAQKRISRYYQTGTEFIVFLFTSDWFLGRGELDALPNHNKENEWSSAEKETVSKVDELFGHKNWREHLLNSDSKEKRMDLLVQLYRNRLHYWFRYVLPFPFTPKEGQTYHLFMCSNYERGIGITNTFYTNYTNNPRYSPDNKQVYKRFLPLHPEKIINRTTRPIEFRALWRIIKDHDEGLCDVFCSDLRELPPINNSLSKALKWLGSKGYIQEIGPLTNAWISQPQLYQLDWDYVKQKLGIPLPNKLKPISKIVPKKPKPKEKPSTLEDFFE